MERSQERELPLGPAVSAPVEISIVVPVFNEAEAIGNFLSRILPVLDGVTRRFEILFVDDGSRDGTYDLLETERSTDGRIRMIRLSRNFGKENALSAGLDFAVGAAVIPMDVDLQDPPDVIPELVARWRDGFDVVLAKRRTRDDDGLMKRFSAGAFYRLLRRLSAIEIPADVGDFRLMDRRVVEVLAELPERSRYMKGIFSWLGFNHAVVEYDRPGRASGSAKQNWRRLFGLALEGIVSFSALPLKIWSYFGFVVAALAALYGLLIVVMAIFYGIDVPGYASLITVILFMNGLVLIGLGVIGEYLARVFTEVKRRPVYIISGHAGVGVLEGRDVATRRLLPQGPEFQRDESEGRNGRNDSG